MMKKSVFLSILVALLASCPDHDDQILAEDDQQLMAQSGNSKVGEELIQHVCGLALYKDLCSTALRAVPESKTADLFELTSISLKVALENGTKLKTEIEELLKTSKSDAHTHQALTDCSGNYDDAVSRIQDSQKALEKKGYNDVNTWVTAAMTDAESCEEGFSDKPDIKSPLTDKNTVFSQLCSTSLTICNLLATGI